jgi:hypothetical protein
VRTQAEARAATPADVIPRFFEGVAGWLEADDFLGCPFLNTAVELSDASHPAAETIRESLAEIGSYLERSAAAAGHPDAAQVGRQLQALLAGSISLAVANRTATHALAARDAAIQLLGASNHLGGLKRPVDGRAQLPARLARPEVDLPIGLGPTADVFGRFLPNRGPLELFALQ